MDTGSSSRPPGNTPDEPAPLLLLMVEWLTREPARLAGFSAFSGYAPEDMMRDISNALPRAVLDYLMQDESLLLQFCADTGTPPEACSRLWHRLQHEHGP